MAKATPKIQRWIDLLVALLSRRWPATFEELIRDIPAYAAGDQSPETRRRMFERDKDELREFGIPIETIQAADEGDAPGYRTLRDLLARSSILAEKIPSLCSG